MIQSIDMKSLGLNPVIQKYEVAFRIVPLQPNSMRELEKGVNWFLFLSPRRFGDIKYKLYQAGFYSSAKSYMKFTFKPLSYIIGRPAPETGDAYSIRLTAENIFEFKTKREADLFFHSLPKELSDFTNWIADRYKPGRIPIIDTTGGY